LINLMDRDETLYTATAFLSEEGDLLEKLVIIGKTKISIVER
jgi:hypothetical protein